MKLSVYQKAAQRTLPNLGESLPLAVVGLPNYKEICLKLNLAHMALGVGSELSELQECLDVPFHTLDSVNLEEEIGDKMWYAVNWANLLGIELKSSNLSVELEEREPIVAIVIYGGQLQDIAKRLLAYNHSLEVQEEKRRSKPNFLTNLEILNRYVNACFSFAVEHGLDFEEILGKNITKLYVRYKDKFTEDEALLRDLEAERVALEGK